MLTQDEILDMVVDTLKTHGPDEAQNTSREDLMADLREGMLAENDGGHRMIDFLIELMGKAYMAGRASNEKAFVALCDICSRS